MQAGRKPVYDFIESNVRYVVKMNYLYTFNPSLKLIKDVLIYVNDRKAAISLESIF